MLASQRYFRLPPPKTLDRSAFADAFLKKYFRRLSVDAIAALNRFTAVSIADQLRRFVLPGAPAAEIIVSGGGALNDTLMRDLARLLAPSRLRSIAEMGIPALAKEPAAVALLALRALAGKINHCPGATGAHGPRVLGKITPPSRG
jgi:anhydro-N-acetylmuramic acid kinase